MKAFPAAALLLLLAYAALAGSAGMHVPAVAVDGGGEIVWLSVEITNGTGLVYTATRPLVGIDTQVSERTAVAVGMHVVGAEIGAHDVFIRMDAGEAREVDGPSAGAAMALLSISALNGSKIRSDVTITGAIQEDGSITQVGGIVDKVKASSEKGIAYVLIPRETRASDKIIILGLEGKYGIRIVEVADIREAAAVAFSPEGSPVPAAQHAQPGRISGISEYEYECPGCEVWRFGGIAQSAVAQNAESVAALSRDKQGAYSDILPFLEKELADSQEALSNGYYYTAANTAFLNEVDVTMAGNMGITRAEAQQELLGAEGCLESLRRPQLTLENMDFVFGGDLRAAWARDKLDSAKKGVALMDDDDYERVLSTYRDALYAAGWCGVASELYHEAEAIGGAQMDERVLEGYARSKVREAETAYLSSGIGDSDTAWHLSVALISINSSSYGAAAFGAGYVMSIVRAANASADEMNATRETAFSRKGRTLWSALFLAHASFYSQAERGAGGTVARLVYIADELENSSLVMREILADPDSAPAFPSFPDQAGAEKVDGFSASLMLLVVLLCGLLVASAALNIVVVTWLRGKKEDGRYAFVKRNKGLGRK